MTLEIRARCAHCGKSFSFLPEAEVRTASPPREVDPGRVVYHPECPYCRRTSDVPRPADTAMGAGGDGYAGRD